jgi:hypothetical protein
MVQAFWCGLSRHVKELGTIYPHKTKLLYPPAIPIPVVILYLPPQHCSLPTKNRFWHVLPFPPMSNGTKDKRHRFVGCRLSLYFVATSWIPAFHLRMAFNPDPVVGPITHSASLSAPLLLSCRKYGAGLCFPDITEWAPLFAKHVRSMSLLTVN